jgi:dTDP-4-amino-4,6-dideoxygalactose transaminase
MEYKVPFVKPRLHYQRLKTEIDAAITGCLARGDLVLRQQLRDFERSLGDFLSVKYAVGLNSGFHALHFALLAGGIGAGDEVVTVAHTFVATISAIVHTGAIPVLVDVGSDFNMDIDALKAAITPRTRAIIPVHLNGRMCDMDRLMEVASKHGLLVIEDAAQALGATFKGRRAGSFGHAACFSFYPFKSLGAFGDGGALVTNDAELARLATLLRFNGEDKETGQYHCHGYTALLDNVQAAVLEVKLRYLPVWIEHRRSVASQYRELLEDISEIELPHFSEAAQTDSFQNYVIRTPHRESLRDHLRANGVETLVHWPKPIWEHRGLGLERLELRETVKICDEVLSLPMSAETNEGEVAMTADGIRDFFSKREFKTTTP